MLGLAVAGTAVAQLILFRCLRLFGAARLSLVTYLLPVTALIYGALILDEPLRASMLGGLALILGGVALGSGRVAAAARDGRRIRGRERSAGPSRPTSTSSSRSSTTTRSSRSSSARRATEPDEVLERIERSRRSRTRSASS